MTSSSGAWLGLAALGLMLLAWLAAGLVTAMLLAVLLVPDHLGFGESLRGWEGQLPDPATFPQSAARYGIDLAQELTDPECRHGEPGASGAPSPTPRKRGREYRRCSIGVHALDRPVEVEDGPDTRG